MKKKRLATNREKKGGRRCAAAANCRDLAAGLRSMGSVAAVLAILSKLQSLGFCAELRIPDAAAASDPSEAFDAVLAAFLRDVYLGGREARPIPAALGDGRCVDLLRLFLSVRAAGGYASVTSSPGGWAAAAESAGVDATLAAAVKLLYAKYLGALDRWIQRLEEAHGPFLVGDRTKRQELFSGANGMDEEEYALLGCDKRDQRHVMLKRKRGDMVGMLGWVREIAQNAGDGGTVVAGSADEYLSMALAVRKVVTRKKVRRASMLNGSHFQVIFNTFREFVSQMFCSLMLFASHLNRSAPLSIGLTPLTLFKWFLKYIGNAAKEQ